MIALKPKQLPPPSNQSGFTIIECLLAIIIVGILMTAIAPAIALSVATRVQARRVEAGTQAAKAFINSVRSNPNPDTNADAKAIAITVYLDSNKKQSGGKYLFNDAVSAPASSTVLTSTATLEAASLKCVDLDGGGCSANSPRDLVVQAFRSTTLSSVPSTPADAESALSVDRAKGYLLGVRVYRADAFDGGSALQSKDAGGRPSATYAGGMGDRKAPLVEMMTEIPPTSGSSSAYSQFCERLGC
jgi:prepilin-type N-terminal cleavage/methylation domain-containing protein